VIPREGIESLEELGVYPPLNVARDPERGWVVEAFLGSS
jgi:hypothetical protein